MITETHSDVKNMQAGRICCGKSSGSPGWYGLQIPINSKKVFIFHQVFLSVI